MRLISAHADIVRYARGLNTDLILHLHSYMMRAAKILSWLRICHDLPTPSLIASLSISCTATAIVRLPLPQRDDRKTWRTCEHPERGWAGEGGLGPNHKSIGFLTNTGSESLENHKATKPAFNAGPSSARQFLCFVWFDYLRLM